MRCSAQLCQALAVLFAGTAMAACQSTLPPTAPTSREVAEQPAAVDYRDGKVAVVADNSSLNEILRDVARRSGMALKGSVIEERVFGTYGPGAPAEVLAALLKGTDSNMMVVAWQSRPAELILSPKQGASAPASPSADREEAKDGTDTELDTITGEADEQTTSQPPADTENKTSDAEKTAAKDEVPEDHAATHTAAAASNSEAASPEPVVPDSAVGTSGSSH